MIQRIQTIFLAASLCFLIPMFFAPVAELISKTGELFSFHLTGFYRVEAEVITSFSSRLFIMIFGILICAMNLIIIFMYRKRILQIRLCIANILLLIVLSGIVLFVLFSEQNIQSLSFNLPAVFPVISIILHFLAIRRIRKDDLLVQSLNRLR